MTTFPLLSVLTTSKCTRRCTSCTMRPWMESVPDYQLSMVQVDSLITATRQSGYRFNLISFTGGEPLLWEHLHEGLMLFKQSGLFRRMQLQTNGDAITKHSAEKFDNIFMLLDRVRVSVYSDTITSRILDLLPLSAGRIEFATKTTHWLLPEHEYPGTLPARCTCGRSLVLCGDDVWVCGSLPTMIPQFGWDPADFIQFHACVGIGYATQLLKLDKFNQQHCTWCGINDKVRTQLVGVSE